MLLKYGFAKVKGAKSAPRKAKAKELTNEEMERLLGL